MPVSVQEKQWRSSSCFCLKLKREVATAAVVAVKVGPHEHTSAAVLMGALLPQPSDLVIVVDLVVLQDRQLNGLVLVRDALGRCKHLLLALLRTATEAQNQVQSCLLLDVVVGERAPVLELLARKDQALLVRRNALLILDLLLHILDCVTRLDVECDRLARQGFDLRSFRTRSEAE
jgi:hypothetical protein